MNLSFLRQNKIGCLTNSLRSTEKVGHMPFYLHFFLFFHTVDTLQVSFFFFFFFLESSTLQSMVKGYPTNRERRMNTVQLTLEPNRA